MRRLISVWDDDIVADTKWRPSPRLKNALVVDLVADDASPEAAQWLLNATHDGTTLPEHLARQLGMAHCPPSSEDTLEFLLPLLDAMLRNWPLIYDAATCKVLAHDATKYMTFHETHAMLVAGPSTWRGSKISAGCRVDGLERELQMVLEKALASALAGMLQRWDEWEVNRLHERRRLAIEAQREAETQADKAAAAAASAPSVTATARGPDGKRIPPPPSLREKRYPPYTRPGRI
jgi:hypothetical protein